MALANTATSVVVVDADLRSSALSRLFGIHGALGLTEVLAGRTTLDAALHSSDGGRLMVLPAGGRPSNPGELLATPTMREVLAELRRRFEVVLIDAPAISEVTDAAVLGSFDSSTLLVLAEGTTTRPRLEDALVLLASGGSTPIGIVLDGIPRRGLFRRGAPAPSRPGRRPPRSPDFVPRYVPRELEAAPVGGRAGWRSPVAVAAPVAAARRVAAAPVAAAPVAAAPRRRAAPLPRRARRPKPAQGPLAPHRPAPSRSARALRRRGSAHLASRVVAGHRDRAGRPSRPAAAGQAEPRSAAPEPASRAGRQGAEPASQAGRRSPRPSSPPRSQRRQPSPPRSACRPHPPPADRDRAQPQLGEGPRLRVRRPADRDGRRAARGRDLARDRRQRVGSRPKLVERPIVVRPDPPKPSSRFAPDPAQVHARSRRPTRRRPRRSPGTEGTHAEPAITGTVINTVSIRIPGDVRDGADGPAADPPHPAVADVVDHPAAHARGRAPGRRGRHRRPRRIARAPSPPCRAEAARAEADDDRTTSLDVLPQPVPLGGSLLGEIGGLPRVEVRAARPAAVTDTAPNPERQARESYEQRARDLERAAHDRLMREQQRLAVSIREQLAHDKRELESVLDNRLEDTVLRPVGLSPRRAADPRFSDPADDDGHTR